MRFNLSEAERSELFQALARRARIVLAAADGLENKPICDEVDGRDAPQGQERVLHPDRQCRFHWFGTRGSKCRLNFLELLRAGHGDYVVNNKAWPICAPARSPARSSPA